VSTPWPLAALVVLGALAAIYRHTKPEILWLAATVIALPLDTPATGHYTDLRHHGGYAYSVPLSAPVIGEDTLTFHQYANARYHIPAMFLGCGLAGLGTAVSLSALAGLLRRRVAAAPLVAVGMVCMAALPGMDLLQRMWMPQREFDLLREGLARIDPSCRVVTLLDVADAGFVPFEYLAPRRMVDATRFLEDPAPEGCSVYYRCGNCFTLDLRPRSEWPSFDMNPACRSIEQRFYLEPIVEAQVAALPFRGELYSRDPLPLGLYRLHERR